MAVEKNTRRNFLKTVSLGSFVFSINSLAWSKSSSGKKVKIGLISDLHQDIMPDGMERLEAFLTFMKKKRVDALVQMGDFAVPKPENQDLISKFNQAHSQTYHVLGNHDIDGGFSWEQCLEAYKIPSRYYAIDQFGIKILVLDGNEKGSPTSKGGYPSYIGKEQQAWIISQLEAAQVPVLIISHQPIAGIYPIDNAQEMQDLLGKYADKILLALNGHAHVDQHLLLQGVNYVHINSASYYWVGGDLKHSNYPEDVQKAYPSLASTCPYSESLFALLTLDLDKKEIQIEGQKATWVGASPQELGYSILDEKQQKENLIPEIRSRKIS